MKKTADNVKLSFEVRQRRITWGPLTQIAIWGTSDFCSLLFAKASLAGMMSMDDIITRRLCVQMPI
ncbi:MAG: hypothetical protein B6245_10115 [Desulfobacteraceae bacterium 4572_88]|nr:MAG: hypothetical protein B6245_10115 [Desulfobacteraceae bacterium 4572_88]RLC12344.1 MAG: hypothetical protein DRI57_17825 [Deltaproteobacteria bacterium]